MHTHDIISRHWWYMEIASDVVKAIFHSWKLDMNFIWSSDWLQWTIYEALCPWQEVEPHCIETTRKVLHELREPPRTPISTYHHFCKNLFSKWSQIHNTSFTPSESEHECDFFLWSLASPSVNSWIENNGTHFLAMSFSRSLSLGVNEP